MTVGRLKGDNISSVNMVRQFTFNLHFHSTKKNYMYIVDVNKEVSSDFFSAFLDLQSIRDNVATTKKELILTDVPITSGKTPVEVANSGKTKTFYESIQAFDHSNY